METVNTIWKICFFVHTKFFIICNLGLKEPVLFWCLMTAAHQLNLSQPIRRVTGEMTP